MWQHQPAQVPTNVAAGDISAFPTGFAVTFNSAYPRGSLFLATFQGPQTTTNASTLGLFNSSRSDEITVNSAGPFSFNASSAFYIRWVVFRAPSGYSVGDQIGWLFPSPAWPATTLFNLIYLQGCTQFLDYFVNPFTATANTVFSTTITLGSGTIITPGYRSTTTELALHTTNTSNFWNGVGNPGTAPDSGSWQFWTNQGYTGLGVSNFFGTFTQRPPVTTGINGRYPVTLNAQVSYLRFGGG